MAKTFESILDTPSSDIERPKPLPTGEYVVAVQGQYRQDKSTKKGTEYVEFTLKILEALDSVDPDKLQEMGGIADKTINATYYLTEKSLWRLKEFLDAAGAGDEDMTLRQRLSETPGQQLIVTVNHEMAPDGKGVFSRVGSVAPIEN